MLADSTVCIMSAIRGSGNFATIPARRASWRFFNKDLLMNRVGLEMFVLISDFILH